ncbi:MAG: cellulase family glycosylhydrolase [Clostridia bacterium]|nr:cellulase family glycosylhydrolase [Clostridia bacterium]
MAYRQNVAPRWRGFNLLGMFCSESSDFYKKTITTLNSTEKRSPGYFKEDEFQIISDWGFDFVRLPLSYRVWGDVKDPFKIDEKKLEPLDEAVYWAQKYGLHVNICIHRGPGYCVNPDEPEKEPFDLFTDDEAQEAFAHHWCEIAKRYKDVPNEKLTLDLINEPSGCKGLVDYSQLVIKTIDKIREISPDRTIVVDGMTWGDTPPVDTVYREVDNIIYSCRGYIPRGVTHYTRRPNIEERFEPKWPGGMESMSVGGKFRSVDRASLDRLYSMWAAIGEIYNAGIHCGEFGCLNNTPHDVVLAFMEDLLSVLKEHNIGWAMWNLCGVFGVLDSERADVEYEDFRGHRLDRKMLELLQKY